MWSHTYNFSLVKLLTIHVIVSGTPVVPITRLQARAAEWLPMDNQTVYSIEDSRFRRLELNTSSISNTSVYITVSPCTSDVRWAVFKGSSDDRDGQVTLVAEYSGDNVHTFTAVVSKHDRYILQLSSVDHGVAAVSVRGEHSKPNRLRLRVRSKRRLSASWNQSPIDPQATSYCVVASKTKPYTSLCAAQYKDKTKRRDRRPAPEQTTLPSAAIRKDNEIAREQLERYNSMQKQNANGYETQIKFLDNTTSDIGYRNEVDTDLFNIYEENMKLIYRKRKFSSRSTKITGEDPVIACVGDRTHHLIEDLDPITTYYVSVFGVGRDRMAGALLASSSVKPKSTVAKRLRENIPYKADVRGKLVLYYKSAVGIGKGLWISITTCSGGVDLEVLARGKRLLAIKNIDPHKNFFVPAPILSSSAQELSDESVQFDSSSSEEARVRYIIRLTPSRKDERDVGIGIELTASTSRWTMNTPELSPDGGDVVRELRPKRTCHSFDVAFFSATHPAAEMIRYCIITQEIAPNETIRKCLTDRRAMAKTQCLNYPHESNTTAIVRKVTGLKPGRSYVVQVTASNKGNTVPYKQLNTETLESCKIGF